MDTENANFEKVFTALREQFGPSVVPMQLPILKGESFVGYVNIASGTAYEFAGNSVKKIDVPDNLAAEVEEYRGILTETAAESSEELMEKYFEGEEFTEDELNSGIRAGILSAASRPCCARPPRPSWPFPRCST